MSSSSSDTALRVLDTSGQGLSKVSQFPKRQTLQDVAAVIADGNNLSTLHGIEQYPSLVQLSACDNSLVRMDEVAPLINLVTLNLQTNSIMDTTGLERLINLQWLCLAGNSIKTMNGLSGNGHLSHLDLSDNCITEFQDLTMLTQLKTLLLHGNAILSLKSVGQSLPPSVNTLTLAENEVADLNEVFFLATLNSLTQLSFMSNPAVSISESTMFDYRPYMIYCCPGLSTLDGLAVTPEERQQSSTLFPPNQPHPFALGEHWALVQYLTSVCPLVGMHTLVTSSMMDDVENINPNSQSSASLSLSGLEEVLKSGGPDTMQKLKALQLVEQMISVQEQLLKSQHEENLTKVQDVSSLEVIPKTVSTEIFNSNEKTSSAPTTIVSGHQHEGESWLKPGPVRHAWNEKEYQTASSELRHQVSPDEKTSIPGSIGPDGIVMATVSVDPGRSDILVQQTLPDEKSSTANDSQTVKSFSLQERKQHQLKLLNQKLAQRHSKLPHKTKPSTKNKPTVEVGVRKARVSHTARSGPKSQPSSSVAKGGTVISSGGSYKQKKDDHAHRLDHNGVATSKSAPTVSTSSINKHSSTHFKSTNIPSLRTSTTTGTKGGPETDAVFQVEDDQLPGPNREGDDDMLDSISHYIPLPDATNGDGLPFDFSDTDTLCDVSSLASSLTQAYGIAHLKDHSQLLSSLVGPAHVAREAQHYDSNVVTQMTLSQTPMPATFTHDVLSGLSTAQGDDGSSIIQLLTDAKVAPPTISNDTVATLYGNDIQHSDIQTHSEVVDDCGGEAAVKIQAAYRGYLTRKRLSPLIREHKAATLIQAVWRGYCARRRDPEVMRVRLELSRIKLEAYVVTLYRQLQGCRQELAHQASVTQLQEETLQSLLVEVEGLRKWRSEVETERRRKAVVVVQKHWRGYSVRKKSHYSGLKLTSSSKALNALCCSLKEEVKEMQLTVATVLDKVRLLEETGQRSPKMGFSEAEMPPATDLTMSHFSPSCVLLRWTPASSPAHLTTVLQGYRIYVNGVPEGMVGASKSKAYIEGLDRDTTYRITIRTVYNNGESCDSNPIVASLSSQKRGVKLNPSPPQTKTTSTDSTDSSHTTTHVPSNTKTPLQQSETTTESSTRSVDVSGHTLDFLPLQHQSNDTNCHHTQVKPPSTPSHNSTDSNHPHYKSQGPSSHYLSSLPNHDHPGNESRMTKPTSLNDASTAKPSNVVSVESLLSDRPHSSAVQDDDSVTDHGVDNQRGLLIEAVPPAKHITDETVSVMSGATEEYISYTGSSPDRDDTTLRNGYETLDSDDILSELGSEAQGIIEDKKDKESHNEQHPLVESPSPANHLSLQDKTQGERNESELNHPQTNTMNNVLTTLASTVQQSGTPVESITTTNHHALPTSTAQSSGVVPHCFMVAHPSSMLFDEISGCQTKHVPSLMHNVVGHGHLQAFTLATTRVPFEPDSLTTAYYNPTTASTTTTAQVGGYDIQDGNNADVHMEVIRSVSNAVLSDCSRQDQLQHTVCASVSIPTPQIPPKVSNEQAVSVNGKLEEKYGVDVDVSSGIEELCKSHKVGFQDLSDNCEVPLVNEVMNRALEHHSPVLLCGMENSTCITLDSQAVGDSQVEGAANQASVTGDAISASTESSQKPEPGPLTTSEDSKMPSGIPEVKEESDRTHVSLEGHAPQCATSSSALLASQLLSQLEADLREARNT